jgi:hypothetical protein
LSAGCADAHRYSSSSASKEDQGLQAPPCSPFRPIATHPTWSQRRQFPTQRVPRLVAAIPVPCLTSIQSSFPEAAYAGDAECCPQPDRRWESSRQVCHAHRSL